MKLFWSLLLIVLTGINLHILNPSFLCAIFLIVIEMKTWVSCDEKKQLSTFLCVLANYRKFIWDDFALFKDCKDKLFVVF